MPDEKKAPETERPEGGRPGADQPEAELPPASHELAWVEALPHPEDRVALWETHPRHPGGEVVLAPGHVRLVALTAGVVNKIREGRLRLTDAPAEVLDEQPWVAKPKLAAQTKPERPKATYRPATHRHS